MPHIWIVPERLTILAWTECEELAQSHVKNTRSSTSVQCFVSCSCSFSITIKQYSNPAHWSATTAIAQISDWRLAQGKLIQGKLIQGKLIQGKLIQGKRIQGKLIQRRPGCKGPCEPFAKLPV